MDAAVNLRSGVAVFSWVSLSVLAGCASHIDDDCISCRDGGARDGSTPKDARADTSADAHTSDANQGDSATAKDAPSDAPSADGSIDGAVKDAAKDGTASDATTGAITGGPCLSGAQGRTAFRIKWIAAGAQAQTVYDEWGLPDKTRERASVYGYSIGFTSSFVDTFLGSGGVQLDSSDFIDIEFSTVGVSSIARATLSIFGRSYATTTSGSFSWTTFLGTGATATNLVSNVAPYEWYSADVGSVIASGDGGALLRVKAGPSSGSLAVNKLELCVLEK